MSLMWILNAIKCLSLQHVDRVQPRKMASCLFSELPAACIQEVLHQLDVQDWANLRQVSSAVSKQITCNIPYISLLLTQHTTTDQLQEWFQATGKFHEVTNILVYINGDVSAEVFDTAMQLMAQRSKPVTELHIREQKHDSYNRTSKHSVAARRVKAHLPTLQPLQQLLPHLRTLVIEGVAVQSMVSDLKQLSAAAAATGGWQQLQSLTLNADWKYTTYSNGRSYFYLCHWSHFWHGLVDLAAAFPNLQDLSLKVPPVGCCFLKRKYTGGNEVHSIAMACEVSDIIFSLDVVGGVYQEMYVRNAVHAEAVAVAMTTAVFHAALQLKQLKFLKTTEAPDIWKPQTKLLIDDSLKVKLGTSKPSVLAIAAATSAAGTARRMTLQTVNPQVHSLPEIVAAAAAVLDTLDHAGGWLLQQDTCLKGMRMEFANREDFIWSLCEDQ